MDCSEAKGQKACLYQGLIMAQVHDVTFVPKFVICIARDIGGMKYTCKISFFSARTPLWELTVAL